MGDLAKNFSKREFACKCGCGKVILHWPLIELLQRIRDRLKSPIYIASGTRCEKHNASVGGHPQSFHLTGRAVDITAGRKFYIRLYLEAEEECPNGLGAYPAEGMIHIDLGDRVSRWIRVEGKYYYAF